MDWSNLPEWLKYATVAALSSLGTIVSGYFVARSDSRRVRADDRVQLTTQLMERLATVERQMAEERDYCDKRMNLMKEDYEARLDKRDRIITELREFHATQEQRITHLEKLLQGLDS